MTQRASGRSGSDRPAHSDVCVVRHLRSLEADMQVEEMRLDGNAAGGMLRGYVTTRQ